MTKPALHALCHAFIEQRIAAARTAMQAAQESSSSETKSSAGDKYETGREMANAERDRNAAHMQQAQQLQAELARISPDAACDTVRPARSSAPAWAGSTSESAPASWKGRRCSPYRPPRPWPWPSRACGPARRLFSMAKPCAC